MTSGEQPVGLEAARRHWTAPAAAPVQPSAARRATRNFALANLAVGLLGFVGAAVTGNDDRIINIRPGKLLGLAATNWLHSLLHLGTGAAILAASRSERASLRAMQATALGFGAMAAMGINTTRGRDGTFMMMGMVIDNAGNLVHLAWTSIGLCYGFGPQIAAQMPAMAEHLPAPAGG